MKKIVIFLLIIFSISLIFPQNRVIAEKRIICPKNPVISCGLQTISGNIVFPASFNKKTVIFAYSQELDLLWNHDFPLEVRGVTGMMETDSGDFVFCGYAMTEDNGTDGFLARTNSLGDLKWVKYFGHQNHETFTDFVMYENSYYCCGTIPTQDRSSTQIWVVKTDLSGNLEWEYNLDKYDFSIGNDIIINEKKEILVCGQARSNTMDSSIILVLDQKGAYVSDRLFYDNAQEQANFLGQYNGQYFLISWRSFLPTRVRILNTNFEVQKESDELGNGAGPGAIYIKNDRVYIAGDILLNQMQGPVNTDLFAASFSFQGELEDMIKISHPNDKYESASALIRSQAGNWILIGKTDEGKIYLIKIEDF